MLLRCSCVIAIFAPLSISMASAALAQDYPSKPIRFVTAPAGGGSDFDARVVAQGITGALGEPVIVDNRGSGLIAGEVVAKAPPDGYTLAIQGGGFWTSPLFESAPYDVMRDFIPVSLIERTVYVLVVHPSLPVKTVKDLIALAKAKPGQLNYASGSTGSATHLAAELLKSMAGIDLVRVPYKGQAPAIAAVIAGEAQLTIVEVRVGAPQAKSGKLRALAVTSADPTILYPGMPTMAASGLPGYETVGMTGMFAPAKTSSAIINRLNQETVRFLKTPEAQEKFQTVGAEAIGSSPEQFSMALKAELARLAKLIKEVGITGQ